MAGAQGVEQGTHPRERGAAVQRAIEIGGAALVFLFGATLLAAALTETPLGKSMGVLAVALAAVNVFGGFLVTRRMLEMFKKKEKKAGAK